MGTGFSSASHAQFLIRIYHALLCLYLRIRQCLASSRRGPRGSRWRAFITSTDSERGSSAHAALPCHSAHRCSCPPGPVPPFQVTLTLECAGWPPRTPSHALWPRNILQQGRKILLSAYFTKKLASRKSSSSLRGCIGHPSSLHHLCLKFHTYTIQKPQRPCIPLLILGLSQLNK